jgi:hypothetical protein
MKMKYGICLMMIMSLISGAQAQYAEWKQAGAFYILTTPEGADLPATASEENFPLLVRLSKENFDFQQAKAGGEDIRFSVAGQPLAYQIEMWDATKGVASIWVRIPLIKGNARQEVKMHWGKADAMSESSGSAVFNASNGFTAVLHMSDPVKDEVGSVEPKDTGTTPAPGIIGTCRRFDVGKGLNCGEKLTTLPTGVTTHSTGVWLKSEKSNVTPIAWGNEQAQGKVVMQLVSPPHIRMDCYFSDGSLESSQRLALNQWLHLVHTYKAGESLIYVNGVLAGATRSQNGSLNIRSPARFYLGGWYNNFQLEGEIDEARLSRVTRSADWVKLEYENQKPLQTLAGSLVQPGSDFSVSQKTITVAEGKSATVTAKAGGAQKVYWLLKENNTETVVGVDSFSYTFPARRVTGDQSMSLQFKAITATGVKTIDIPVTVKEELPDPVFTLKAPAKWDGRTTIEVVPQISNLAALQAKGVGELIYSWDVSGIATIQKNASGKLILTRAQNSGKMVVTATINNGGQAVSQSVTIQVKEPKKDAWVQRIPEKNEKPVEGQFYARDDKNEGTLYYNGTLSNAAEKVFVKLYADNKLIKTETAKPAADKSYAFTLKLKPGLIQYKVELGTKTAGQEKVLETVNDLVCGDAFIIDGQSNALATDTHEQSPPETNKWIRSYGRPSDSETAAAVNMWCYPVWKAQKGEKAELGWWGMCLAKRLHESQKVPIFILQAAAGGTRIDQHLPNPQNRRDTSGANPWTNPYKLYGSLLTRVEGAKLTHGIRAIIWHQGENNQGTAGPTGDYDWKSYQDNFIAMSASWKQDFPNVQHYTVFQIFPNSCSMGGGNGDMLRERQRTLPSLYSNMSILSTLGVRPPGGAHYPLEGWAVFARMLQPIIEKEIYGKVPAGPVTSPNVKSVKYAGSAQDKIAVEFDQPVVWADTLAGEFYLDGEKGKVASGAVSGNVLTLNLQGPASAKKISYIKEMSWSQDRLLIGANGLAALTFANVPIEK